VEASFRDVDYIATLSILGGHTLRVEVERKADAHCWSGNFPAQRARPARLVDACSRRAQKEGRKEGSECARLSAHPGVLACFSQLGLLRQGPKWHWARCGL
jgi:hypothetical protein